MNVIKFLCFDPLQSFELIAHNLLSVLIVNFYFDSPFIYFLI